MSSQILWLFVLFLFWLLLSSHLSADIYVEDDLGREITLSKPAQRVISLAPHLTEVVYTVGGGDRMVAQHSQLAGRMVLRESCRRLPAAHLGPEPLSTAGQAPRHDAQPWTFR